MKPKDDGLKHLRMGDGWRIAGGYDVIRSVCERHVYTADTYESPKMGGRLTCPDCAVFADAWLTAGMKGHITVRRARAFRREVIAPWVGDAIGKGVRR